jgi:hypothetical protein
MRAIDYVNRTSDSSQLPRCSSSLLAIKTFIVRPLDDLRANPFPCCVSCRCGIVRAYGCRVVSAAASQLRRVPRPCAPWPTFARVLEELQTTTDGSVATLVTAHASGCTDPVLTTLRALGLVDGDQRSTLVASLKRGNTTVVRLLEQRFEEEVAIVRGTGTPKEISDRLTELGRGEGEKVRLFIEGAVRAGGETIDRPRRRRSPPRPNTSEAAYQAVGLDELVVQEIGVLMARQQTERAVADVLRLSTRIEELRGQIEHYRGDGSVDPR